MLTALLAVAADEPSGWPSNKLVLAAVAALLGFLSGFALELFKKKSGTRTELSWSLRVEEPKLSLGKAGTEQLKISYGAKAVDKLVSIHCTLANTGTTAIKNQFVRFKVPTGATMLGHDLDPKPEPEMGVQDVTESELEFAGPRYKVEHLDPGESVTFLLAADGGNWRDWNDIVFRNKDMDVAYQRRDVSPTRDEQEHVASFLFAITTTLIIALLISADSLIIWTLGRFPIYFLPYLIIVITTTLLIGALGAYLISKARKATRSMVRLWAGTERAQQSLTADKGSWIAFVQSGYIHVERPTTAPVQPTMRDTTKDGE